MKHGDNRYALFETEREHSGRGIAHVRLFLVNEFHCRGRVRWPRLEGSRDIAEIAVLLADPVGIVVEHFDRAARRNPPDRGRPRRPARAPEPPSAVAVTPASRQRQKFGDDRSPGPLHHALSCPLPLAVVSFASSLRFVRWRSRLPARPSLAEPGRRTVDRDADDREHQNDREELRHPDQRGIIGQPVAQALGRRRPFRRRSRSAARISSRPSGRR